MNPTNAVLEERVASIEGGAAALALSSGSSATALAIQNLCSAEIILFLPSPLWWNLEFICEHL